VKSGQEQYDLIFFTLFEQSRTLDPDRTPRPGSEPEGLIEVSLLSFDGCEARWPIVGAAIEVAYQATLFAKNGAAIASWEGHGRAGPSDNLEGYKEPVPLLQAETRYLGAVTSLAMRRAAADFVINFERGLRLRAWIGQ